MGGFADPPPGGPWQQQQMRSKTTPTPCGKGLRNRNPIPPFNKGWRFVRASFRQPTFFPTCRPPQDRAKRCSAEARDDRELLLDFAAQRMNALTHAAIDFLEFPLHHPKRRIVSAVQLLHFSRKPLPDAWI